MTALPRPPHARGGPQPDGSAATAPAVGVWRMGFFLVCCAAFVYGVFRPEPPPNLFEDSDKAMHVLAFGTLAFSIRLAFARVRGAWLWPLLIALAPVMEWLQHVVQPGRHFSLGDIQANLLGVAAALAASALLHRIAGARL